MPIFPPLTHIFSQKIEYFLFTSNPVFYSIAHIFPLLCIFSPLLPIFSYSYSYSHPCLKQNDAKIARKLSDLGEIDISSTEVHTYPTLAKTWKRSLSLERISSDKTPKNLYENQRAEL